MIAAHELGVIVPAQLSVAGFDDSQLATVVWPSLTTIHQPTYDMAYTATELLVDLVRGRAPPAVTKLAHQLVKRRSTVPPPGA
jgi:LacI family transcriptional regulator